MSKQSVGALAGAPVDLILSGNMLLLGARSHNIGHLVVTDTVNPIYTQIYIQYTYLPTYIHTYVFTYVSVYVDVYLYKAVYLMTDCSA